MATRRHVKKEVLTLQPEGGINVGTKFNISPSLMCQYISVSTAKCERWWHREVRDRGSLQSLAAVLQAPWKSVPKLMAVHLIAVEIFL